MIALRRFALPVAAGALLAVAGACRMLPFIEPRVEGPYGAALERWTQKKTLYTGLETRAFVRVTYLSPEFVEAQARELSRLRAEPPDVAARTLERLQQDAAAPTFVAIVYTPDHHDNDWNQSDSVWRVAMNLGLGQTSPSGMQRIEKPFTAEQRALYPDFDDWSVGYIIKFPPPLVPPPPGSKAPPRPFEPRKVELVAAGALGRIEFTWDLAQLTQRPLPRTAGR